MKKKAVILFLSAMLAAGSLTGCGSLDESAVAVSVNDKELTADVANFYARYMQAQYETYYGAYLGDDMWNTEAEEGETYEESVKNAAKESLEIMLLCEEHMGDYEVSLSDGEKEEISKTAKEFAEDNSLEDKEKISGSAETAERVLTLMAIQGKVQEAIEAGADTEVSDEEAAQKAMQYVFFSYTTTDDTGASQELSEEEKAAVKENAQAFVQAVQGGDDFATAATEYGGELSDATFDAESVTPSEEVVAAADSLEAGANTDVIETDAGCYVAKVTSLLDQEATETKKAQIVDERKAQLYQDTCDEWREEADIKEHDSVWKKIDFNDLSVTIKQSSEEPYADEVQTDDQAEAQENAQEAE